MADRKDGRIGLGAGGGGEGDGESTDGDDHKDSQGYSEDPEEAAYAGTGVSPAAQGWQVEET